MRSWIQCAVVAAVVGSMSPMADAASILALGDNRAAIYSLEHTGSAATSANWSPTVGLYARLNLAAGEGAYSLTRDDATNNLYVSTVYSAGGGRILKVTPSGVQTTLA